MQSPTKKAPDLPLPGGPHGFFFVFRWHFFRLLWLDVLFLLCCLPVVTVPAALCGLTAVLQKLLRTDHCDVFSDFFAEFRRDFLPRTAILLALILLPAGVYALLQLFSVNGLLAAAVYTVYLLMLCGYYLPLLVIAPDPPLRCLRDAALLQVSNVLPNLKIILLYAPFFLAFLIFWPYGTILLFFFSFVQLGVCAAVNPTLR